MKKINVLHLRVEEDAAEHWGKMNNMEKMSLLLILKINILILF